jgi:hypothetical protein
VSADYMVFVNETFTIGFVPTDGRHLPPLLAISTNKMGRRERQPNQMSPERCLRLEAQ